MKDLFSVEQKIYDDATLYLEELKNGAVFSIGKLEEFVEEYGRLLKQLRMATKMSDRTTGSLITSKIDLLDKVNFDALTGIYNRRFMEENFKRVIHSVARSKDKLSVMMIDIDFFKSYNDTYGHNKGDDCIKAVAKAIEECLPRADDFAARYGGDEFVVVLPNTDENGARIMANKILEAVKKLNVPHEKDKNSDYVTISIGVTTGKVEHWQSGEDYIKRADMALYSTKEKGRNCYTFVNYKEEVQ